MDDYSILDEYIKQNGQIIILIIGMMNSLKSKISKELLISLNENTKTKIKLINLCNFYKKDKHIKFTDENDTFNNYDINSNYNFNELNKTIKEHKNVIIYGSTIDITKIDFKINFTFLLSSTKTRIKECIEKQNIMQNEELIQKYVKKYYLPYYDNLKEKIKLDKIVNIKKIDETDEEIIDKYTTEIFDVLKHFIENIVYKSS
jgi:hypothetical protein